MNPKYFYLFAPLLLASCTQPSAYSKKNAEIEIVVQQIQSEVEALKHDIRCQNMEIRMIEGKLVNAQETLSLFKNEIMTTCQNTLIDMQGNVKSLKKSSLELEINQGIIKEGLATLDSKSDTLSKCLNMYKNRVKNIEIKYDQQQPKQLEKKAPTSE